MTTRPAALTDDGSIEFIGGFETTYMPVHDRDITETTEHDIRWFDDVATLQATGVGVMRYAVRWHRIEVRPGHFDWAATDRQMEHLRESGIVPIVDLVHHTSYPRWLSRGFADVRFPAAYLRYVDAFARRYPWVEQYTLFNEPFSTLFLAGHEAIWQPYHAGEEAFVGLLGNVLPAVAEASRRYRELLPGARHVWTDTCERHTGSTPGGRAYARMANDRRFIVSDLFLGRGDSSNRFTDVVVAAGGERLLAMEPGFIDVLGLDYYAHCQWHFSEGSNVVPTPEPMPLHEQISEYWQRYEIPCILSETNIRGYASDRATWLKYTLEQCELARAGGVPLLGYCWFPFIDSTDWDSLLYRCVGNIDPVGVQWLDDALHRRTSSMSRAYSLAAGGAPASTLPAYELAEPVASWLRGYLPQMSHWDWQPRPTERCSNTTPADARMELRILDAS